MGLNSLLQNLAERSYDQAGSYLVRGFDSFIGGNDDSSVQVVTNAGRAYIQGIRLQKDLPTTTTVPKSVATKSVRGKQKTYNISERRYALNCTPLKETAQVEAIVEITANVTRGSVGGGEDLLAPNPVVDILEVSQGATVFQEGVDWQQSGNNVDWLGSGNEPAIGTTYTVRWTYVKQMVKGMDYVDGGWFGQSGYPAAADYYYVVTALSASGETAYSTGHVVSRQTAAGEVNLASWRPISGATGYRVYRATQNSGRTDFRRLAELGPGATSYIDDGVDQTTTNNPPASNSSGLSAPDPTISLGNTSVINFGRTGVGSDPVNGSNCSIDYDYYLGRKDIIYATAGEIKRVEGAPSDFPKLPIVPEGSLALCSVDCPPNSIVMSVRNFGLVITRVERFEVTNTMIQQQTIVQQQTMVREVEPRVIRVPVERIVWRTRPAPTRWDPLAQTFSFTKNRIISAIGLYFTRKDASIPVTVQIRGVTTGLPNETVLAEKVIHLHRRSR